MIFPRGTHDFRKRQILCVNTDAHLRYDPSRSQVLAAFLRIIQVTRNNGNLNTWYNLRASLKDAQDIMMAAVEMPARQQITTETIVRGGRIVNRLVQYFGTVAPAAVLAMFTDVLPKAHRINNESHSADLARIRKT